MTSLNSDDIAIKVENLSKIYKLYDSPLDRMKESLHWRGKKYHKDFYALNGISFEIKKGDTVGIIGKNGSGKSTLLKIITGVLTPTSGKVTVNGRISALLELGAGFNPEYTGLENIYFQGNLMGYEQEEIDAKVETILEFADIGEFIHQPVKMYSSGMFARLAFAVAINGEPDILIVDEALSVGDAKFQMKCFDKIQQIKLNGCCVLFVSHSLEQIKQHCQSAILLDEGTLLSYGESKDICTKYNKLLFQQNHVDESLSNTIMNLSAMDDNIAYINTDLLEKVEHFKYELNKLQIEAVKPYGYGGAKINYVGIYGLKKPNLFEGNEHIKIEVDYSWKKEVLAEIQLEHDLSNDIVIGFSVAEKAGLFIFAGNSYDAGIHANFLDNDYGKYIFDIAIPYLKTGKYFINLAVTLGTLEKFVQLCRYDFIVELECIGHVDKQVFGFIGVEYTVTKLINNS